MLGRGIDAVTLVTEILVMGGMVAGTGLVCARLGAIPRQMSKLIMATGFVFVPIAASKILPPQVLFLLLGSGCAAVVVRSRRSEGWEGQEERS